MLFELETSNLVCSFYRCQDVSRCVRMWQHVSRCVMMCQDVSGCVRICHNVSGCVNMCQDGSGWVRMGQDVSTCVKVCQDVSGCVRMVPLALTQVAMPSCHATSPKVFFFSFFSSRSRKSELFKLPVASVCCLSVCCHTFFWYLLESLSWPCYLT